MFAAASAIIAFRGWPGIDTSTGPARQVLSVTPPPSGVARRLAHIATTAKRPAASRHPSFATRAASHTRAASGGRAHHARHGVTGAQHGPGTTTPRTTSPAPTRHVHPVRAHHRHSGGPLHSKSYPVSTHTTPTTSAPTTPAPTAPTATTAVTTAPTSPTTTSPVKIRVGVGHGHIVTITTVPTTTTPTIPTGPITITQRAVTTPTTPDTTTPTVTIQGWNAPGQGQGQGQGDGNGQGQGEGSDHGGGPGQGDGQPGWAGPHGH